MSQILDTGTFCLDSCCRMSHGQICPELRSAWTDWRLRYDFILLLPIPCVGDTHNYHLHVTPVCSQGQGHFSGSGLTGVTSFDFAGKRVQWGGSYLGILYSKKTVYSYFFCEIRHYNHFVFHFYAPCPRFVTAHWNTDNKYKFP